MLGKIEIAAIGQVCQEDPTANSRDITNCSLMISKAAAGF